MRITTVDYERLDLELTEPYTIAYETISRASNLILYLGTDRGIIGMGCAAPDPEVTGETGDDVEKIIRTVITPALLGQNPLNYAFLIESLRSRLNSSALAMVDLALHDIMAKKADVPLYQLLGGYRDCIATSVTVTIMPTMAETMAKTTQYVDQGFGIIKLKGGLDVQEDLARLQAMRDKYPKLTLRFDGNQGYSLDQALRFVTAAQPIGVEILEQPTTIEDEELMGEVSMGGTLPVMADESLKTLKDAFRLTRNDFTDMINIKLQKVGGLTPGLHINSVALAAGNEVMVGCLDECGLGISAGLHFALSRRNIVYADLDGHLDFVEDPFGDLFTIEKGVMRPNGVAGLGRE
ncbi:mandelate racemase/muconate lactonizing enzyme family protein [Neolewinella antarctica]|uniref:Dipeptide epimerase n=1 Tax=Neolewinella antarctica TaxID=442734 RepID=A0ABX0XHY9_9BACT|nr:dipeptide epimerase [Neolewinella antarctica]NJC28368.1 L-alanine-DL-glutamate epimerase-like enolase superfamily enzyme [Neolewinella antarctica]